ncbi:SAM-dependent methyltransferase [Kutzneria viridogrisea]|uniref:S-adenosyl methyltransferase n=1 Tax=Kutzneria viridogrisea TaxID=47990 RepID=A0ABR6BCA4_9PSEU|nr:hypothetical protein [Kutzneria viridogrisea]
MYTTPPASPGHLDWAPEAIDPTTPRLAGIHDFLLDGARNTSHDRAAAADVLTVLPEARRLARDLATFQRRAIAYLTRRGVDQFLDLGAGVLTAAPPHVVARRVTPGARVVYVDNDPVVHAHNELVLRDTDNVAPVYADLTEPGTVLAHPRVRDLIDPTRPVGVLLGAADLVPDNIDLGTVIGAYRAAMPAGSAMVLSHLTDDHRRDQVEQAGAVYARTGRGIYPRGRAEIARLLAGWGTDLVSPGLVPPSRWRPEFQEPGMIACLAYVGVAWHWPLLVVAEERSVQSP